jgi:RNA polymerase I-specific transcription initiation factor RRN3
MQFARVAQATDFVYCYTILETNKRADISLSASSIKPGNQSSRESLSTSMTILHTKVLCEPVNAELNTFFPFDPYRLPKSNTFIQDVYREWSSVAIDDEEDDSDDDDDEGEPPLTEPSSEGETHSKRLDIPNGRSTRGKTSDENDGGLGESLGKMSISPARTISISIDMIRQ